MYTVIDLDATRASQRESEYETLDEARGGIVFDGIEHWQVWCGDTLIEEQEGSPIPSCERCSVEFGNAKGQRPQAPETFVCVDCALTIEPSEPDGEAWSGGFADNH